MKPEKYRTLSKASIEITSSVAGTMGQIFLAEEEEINVTESTKVCEIILGPSEDDAPASTATAASSSAPAASHSSSRGTPLSKLQQTMVKNMTVQPGDTLTFGVSESVPFSALKQRSKEADVSPTITLAKIFAESISQEGLNKKLSPNKTEMLDFGDSVDLGLAIEVEGQLRVAVLRDVVNKSPKELREVVENWKALGKKLPIQDQDLTTVSFVLTTLGKSAPESVNPTLTRGVSGILGVGRVR